MLCFSAYELSLCLMNSLCSFVCSSTLLCEQRKTFQNSQEKSSWTYLSLVIHALAFLLRACQWMKTHPPEYWWLRNEKWSNSLLIFEVLALWWVAADEWDWRQSCTQHDRYGYLRRWWTRGVLTEIYRENIRWKETSNTLLQSGRVGTKKPIIPPFQVSSIHCWKSTQIFICLLNRIPFHSCELWCCNAQK